MCMKKKALSLIIGGLVAAVSVGASAKTVLKLSHNNDKTHPVHISMQYMADEVKKASDGDLIIRIYPNSQLGNQRESMELLQAGSLDMAKSNASELEAFEPTFAAFNVPYLFKNSDHYYKVLQDGDVGQKILNNSAGKGFIGLTYYDAGARSFYAKKPIKTPADLKGMKIRVQPSPSALEMVKLLGASPTPLAFGELYTALQQGVVDGAENNQTALTLMRHGEVAKFFSEDEHTIIPDVLVISEKTWAKLTPEQQKIMKEAADKSMMYHKDLWVEMTAKEVKEAKEKLGVEFVTVDKQPFIDAVKPMHDKAQNDPVIGQYIEKIDALGN